MDLPRLRRLRQPLQRGPELLWLRGRIREYDFRQLIPGVWVAWPASVIPCPFRPYVFHIHKQLRLFGCFSVSFRYVPFKRRFLWRCWIKHSGRISQPQRLLDHHVPDPLELLLAGKGEPEREVLLIGPEHFFPELVPQFVCPRHALILCQLLHNLIHHRFQRRFQVAVLLFTG